MLKSIALQKRTGLLHVEQLGERSTRQGEIYFENGRMLRAQTGKETGNAALQCIGEWKQITCSFQGISRPHPAITCVLTPEQGYKAEEKRLIPVSQTTKVPQTDTLTPWPESLSPSTGKERTIDMPADVAEVQTERLNTRQAGSTRGVPMHTPLPPTGTNRPLILRGTQLEEYRPRPQVKKPHTIQRWTTHIISETPPPTMPQRPPATPRLGLLPGEEARPGRGAIFKARALVATHYSIQRMERRERIVFILLDGRRTIQDIARLTHQPETDVEEILMHLTKGGFTQYIRG
jgi:hypothetical protein